MREAWTKSCFNGVTTDTKERKAAEDGLNIPEQRKALRSQRIVSFMISSNALHDTSILSAANAR
jgi:hypothetical protein